MSRIHEPVRHGIAGTIDFYEVKVDRARFDKDAFSRKIEAFFEKHPEKKSLRRSARCLSLDDM